MQSFPGRKRNFVRAKKAIRQSGVPLHATWSQRQQRLHAERLLAEKIRFEELIAECKRKNAELCNQGLII